MFDSVSFQYFQVVIIIIISSSSSSSSISSSIYSLEFLTSANADGLSLEFEWQQVSLSLQDSSQYSGRSQQRNSLDSLHSSSYLQVV